MILLIIPFHTQPGESTRWNSCCVFQQNLVTQGSQLLNVAHQKAANKDLSVQFAVKGSLGHFWRPKSKYSIIQLLTSRKKMKPRKVSLKHIEIISIQQQNAKVVADSKGPSFLATFLTKPLPSLLIIIEPVILFFGAMAELTPASIFSLRRGSRSSQWLNAVEKN